MLKLLIVEDNRFNRKFLDSALTGDSFEKKYAETGHEALKIYRDWKPDIILLDLMIPFMDGFSVLNEIRLKDRATTVIVITSLTDRNDVVQCARLGIQGYLVKPINPRDIKDRILSLHRKAHPETPESAQSETRETAHPEVPEPAATAPESTVSEIS